MAHIARVRVSYFHVSIQTELQKESDEFSVSPEIILFVGWFPYHAIDREVRIVCYTCVALASAVSI